MKTLVSLLCCAALVSCDTVKNADGSSTSTLSPEVKAAANAAAVAALAAATARLVSEIAGKPVRAQK